jgi:EAL domain-containing protein (putative c-di-GMP-specific phosphodiesterase class I)
MILVLIGAAMAAVALAVRNGRRAKRLRSLEDPVSGLPNLAALEVAIDRNPASMVVVARIDRLAAIAASLGEAAETRLVRAIADRVRLSNFDRIVYRTGEATLAWLEQPGDEATLEDRLQKTSAAMRGPVNCGHSVDVVMTMGMSADPPGDALQMTANATLAATQAYRNGFRWDRFSPTRAEALNVHRSLLVELDSALASGQIWNAYQPKMDLKSSRIIGCEALVRWLHPERGPIAPDDFIPLVEQHGRARDLTLYVLGQGLEDALHWESTGRPIGIAVNVSAGLLSDDDFVEQVAATLDQSPIPAERITIEITESAAIEHEDKAIDVLNSWRALGVNISIDDYGTGQSSLGYLRKLPATELKIDMSFIQTMDDDPRNAIMVKSTIGLAHELGMKVVAEGIEDARCLAMLAEMGCDTGQGYHIGRPMSAGNLSVFLGGTHRAAA